MTGDTPLIIEGSRKEPGWFEKTSKFKSHIIGKVNDNCNYHSPAAIEAFAWPIMFEHLQNKRVMLLKVFGEKPANIMR